MATQIVVAIRDRAAAAFLRPFFVPSTGMATRMFRDEVNRNAADNTMYAHPDDFDLYEIGIYDEESGILIPNEGGPRQIAVGKDMKERMTA